LNLSRYAPSERVVLTVIIAGHATRGFACSTRPLDAVQERPCLGTTHRILPMTSLIIVPRRRCHGFAGAETPIAIKQTVMPTAARPVLGSRIPMPAQRRGSSGQSVQLFKLAHHRQGLGGEQVHIAPPEAVW